MTCPILWLSEASIQTVPLPAATVVVWDGRTVVQMVRWPKVGPFNDSVWFKFSDCSYFALQTVLSLSYGQRHRYTWHITARCIDGEQRFLSIATHCPTLAASVWRTLTVAKRQDCLKRKIRAIWGLESHGVINWPHFWSTDHFDHSPPILDDHSSFKWKLRHLYRMACSTIS